MSKNESLSIEELVASIIEADKKSVEYLNISNKLFKTLVAMLREHFDQAVEFRLHMDESGWLYVTLKIKDEETFEKKKRELPIDILKKVGIFL